MKASSPPTGELSPGDDSASAVATTDLSRRHLTRTGVRPMLISIIAIAIGASLGALLRWYSGKSAECIVSAASTGYVGGEYSWRIPDWHCDRRVLDVSHAVAAMAIAHGHRLFRRASPLFRRSRPKWSPPFLTGARFGAISTVAAHVIGQRRHDALWRGHSASRPHPDLGEMT